MKAASLPVDIAPLAVNLKGKSAGKLTNDW